MTTTSSDCRCGWSGDGPHLCHRCHQNVGKERFFVPSMQFSLAGAQLKFNAKQTIGCDECWKKFKEDNKDKATFL